MESQPDAVAMARPDARAARSPAGLVRATLAAWGRTAGGRCAVCRGWCDGGLCVFCEARFAVERARCAGCAMPLAAEVEGEACCVRCRLAPPPWSRVVAGVDYGYPWDGLLAGFKFNQRLEHRHVLAAPLLARLRRGAGAGAGARRLVPIPLSRERLRERGYNQSWLLARALARELGLEARVDALFRVRDTGHQLGLRRAERDANLRGAFVVTPRHAAWVRGAAVALVDDVLTTGATARAATRTLLAAGARDVQLWVVARTPS